MVFIGRDVISDDCRGYNLEREGGKLDTRAWNNERNGLIRVRPVLYVMSTAKRTRLGFVGDVWMWMMLLILVCIDAVCA